MAQPTKDWVAEELEQIQVNPVSDLKIPEFKEDFPQIADVLKYEGFCKQMDSTNAEFINRPLMENRWRNLCNDKVKAYVKEHGQNAETDKMLYRCSFAENQIAGYENFDVETYWALKEEKALQHGIKLNIKSMYDSPAEMRDYSDGRHEGRSRWMDPVQFKRFMREASTFVPESLFAEEEKKEQEYRLSRGAADTSEGMKTD